MAIPALFDLTGQTAVITGSSRGIGRAIAHRMAEHGANVVVSSRKLDACEETAEWINGEVGRAAAIATSCNISSKDSIAEMVELAVRTFGQVDHLVCNAASNPYYGPLEKIGDEQFEKILQNNIISNHWLIQQVAPAMRERSAGTVTVVSSIGGLRASTVIGAYNISKAADLQLVRNYAAELGPHGIRVNAICPGLVKTDFAKALWDDPDRLKASTDRAPLRRIGEPDDIAGGAVFLAAPAGAFMAGHALVMDGGVTIGG